MLLLDGSGADGTVTLTTDPALARACDRMLTRACSSPERASSAESVQLALSRRVSIEAVVWLLSPWRVALERLADRQAPVSPDYRPPRLHSEDCEHDGGVASAPGARP